MSWGVGMQGTKEQILAKVSEEHARGHMPEDHRAALEAALKALPASISVVSISAYGHRAAEDNVSPLSNLSIMVSGAQ